MAQMNGTGKGGKTFNDRELAAEVRTLTLQEIKKILKGKQSEYKKAVVLRLAGCVLPRLNEHTGEGGGAIQVQPIYGGSTINTLPQDNGKRQDTATP